MHCQIQGGEHSNLAQLNDELGLMVVNHTLEKSRKHIFQSTFVRKLETTRRGPFELLMFTAHGRAANSTRHRNNQMQLLLAEQMIVKLLYPQHVARNNNQ